MTDPRLHDELRRYWDELVQGGPATPGELDPALVSLIRQLHASRDDIVPPDAVYSGQLREDLMIQAGLANSEPLVPLYVSDAVANGRTQPRHRQRGPIPAPTRDRQRWGFGQLATVGLLLTVLALVFFTLGPFRSGDRQVATAPPSGPSEEMLFSVELPAEALAPGRVGSQFHVVTILPGNRSTWRPTCCPGPMIEYVVEGAYAVRAEAAIRVIRADGAIEEVPAGTEVALGPGDGLISRNETVVEAANGGDTPVTLLSWLMVDDDTGTFSRHLLPGWTQGDTDWWGQMTIPARPGIVRIKRVTLPPKVELPLPPPDTLQLCVTLREPYATGTPFPRDTVLRTNGAIYNSYPEAITAYLITLEFSEDPRKFSAVAGSLPP